MRALPTAPEKSRLTVTQGFLCAALATFLWASSATVTKHVFTTHGVPPALLIQFRTFFSALFFLIVVALRDRSLLVIQKKDIPYFIVLGTIGLGLNQASYLYAISHAQVALAVLLEGCAPLMVAIYMVIFRKVKLTAVVVTAVLGTTFGCWLVSVGGGDVNLGLNWQGALFGLLAAMSFAWYSIHGEYALKRYSGHTVLLYALIFAAIVWNFALDITRWWVHPFNTVQVAWMLYVVVVGTILPLGLYLKGVGAIGATRATIVATLEPLFAALIAWISLEEKLHAVQILGMCLILGSILFLRLRSARTV